MLLVILVILFWLCLVLQLPPSLLSTMMNIEPRISLSFSYSFKKLIFLVLGFFLFGGVFNTITCLVVCKLGYLKNTKPISSNSGGCVNNNLFSL